MSKSPFGTSSYPNPFSSLNPNHSYHYPLPPAKGYCGSTSTSLTSTLPPLSLVLLLLTGGRTAPEIVNWLLKKTGPPAIELTDVEAAKKFSEKDEVVLIAFFEDLESKGALAFKAVAEIQDSLAFGITSSQEAAEALGCSLDSIVLFKQVSHSLVWALLQWNPPL